MIRLFPNAQQRISIMAIDQKYVDEAVKVRRTLHRRPEEGWTEFETTYLIVQTLKSYGFEDIQFGKGLFDPAHALGRNEALIAKAEERAIEHGVPADFIKACEHFTGAMLTYDTGRPGKTVAFRVDIDCVKVEETQDPEHEANKEGFASEIPGNMHACGHDSHTASGLALAHWVADHKDELSGVIKIIFQPAEEGTRGASGMAASGIVDHVDYLFGLHVGGNCHLGQVSVIRNGFLATTKMDVHFTGAPSHAGSDPEKGRSALMAAADAALLFQGISRHSQGASRISVGTMHAGEGRNVTPVHAVMQIETRGATHEINQYMTERVKNIVEGVKQAYEVQGDVVKVGEGTTICVDEDACRIAEEVAEEVVGKDNVIQSQPGASEDFTMMLRRAAEHGAKGAYFMFGCNHHGHHRANFEIQDTQSLPVGIAMLVGILKKISAKA